VEGADYLSIDLGVCTEPESEWVVIISGVGRYGWIVIGGAKAVAWKLLSCVGMTDDPFACSIKGASDGSISLTYL